MPGHGASRPTEDRLTSAAMPSHLMRGACARILQLGRTLVALVVAGCSCVAVSPPAPVQPSQAFLRVSDFYGSWTPGPGTMPIDGGQSTFDGDLIFVNLDRNVVEDILPAGLTLAPNTGAPAKHPVMLILAHHASMQWILPG